MALGAYIGANGTAQKIKSLYIGVNGIARRVLKGYIGVNGVARMFYISAPLPDFLIDFNGYTRVEGDKETYVITGWKGTLNGEPSTELVIPDNENILL